MVKNLRPKQAAEALGISLATFWRRAKDEPDFPPLIKLGDKMTVVRESDLADYTERKLQAQLAKGKAASAAQGEAVAA